MIHQDATNDLRCHSKEVRAILPLDASLIDEAEIGVMHESGGLQRMSAILVTHIAASDAVKFVVDERHQLIACCRVALAPIDQEASYFVARLCLHVSYLLTGRLSSRRRKAGLSCIDARYGSILNEV